MIRNAKEKEITQKLFGDIKAIQDLLLSVLGSHREVANAIRCIVRDQGTHQELKDGLDNARRSVDIAVEDINRFSKRVQEVIPHSSSSNYSSAHAYV